MRELLPYMRMMLAYRWRLAGAVAASLVGAASLGAGLGGMVFILQHILGKNGKNLPALLGDLDGALAGNTVAGWVGLRVPAEWIARVPTGAFEAVVWVVGVLSVMTVIGSVANYLHSYLALTVAGRTLVDLRSKVFAHTLSLPSVTVMTRGPSTLVSQVVFDTQQVWGGYVVVLQRAVGQTLKGSAAIGVALALDWRITLGGIALGVVLGGVIRRIGTRIRRASRKGLEAQGELQRLTNEAIGQIRVVKTNNAESVERERFAQAAAVQLRQEMKVRAGKSLSGPLTEMVGLLAIGGLALLAAGWITSGRVEADRLLGTLASLGLAAGCLKPLTSLYSDLQITAAAAQRLTALLGLAREDAGDAGRPALARHGRSLEFEGVTLTYPGATAPALDGVSLTVRHGETVAIVGPNGSGKTTLLSVVSRVLEPDRGADGRARGRVLIDGVDIAGVSLGSLRRQIGVVTQESALFKGSVWWNIAYGAGEGVTDEMVRSAAQRARAEGFISAKPGGYNFEIGEGGSGLSGGQRQRVCIARAILRDPAVLILDEATSMVDADSERQIAEAIAEFGKGRTCLIVAHRLSTVVHADRIVVMNHGKIEDVGSHGELLGRCETYRLIAENQLLRADGVAGGTPAAQKAVVG